MYTSAINLPAPYLVFVGDLQERRFAKTALGLKDFAPDKCVGEFACCDNAISTGLPRLSFDEAISKGAKALVIAVSFQGGTLSPSWIPSLVSALESGLDIISGLHVQLESVPELANAAKRTGRALINVRVPPENLPVGDGRKRQGKRLLTVGTDCALGKKYTAMSLTRSFKSLGLNADFRATGQTGIMLSGNGLPMDAVVADFSSGAAEVLSPDSSDDHWDIIEGQGSLFHPGFAGVSLSLLHGSQPDVVVMCHEPGRTHMAGTAGYEVPDIQEAIELTLCLGKRTNPAIRCAGVSLNTSKLSVSEAEAVMLRMERVLQLPVADPIRGGGRFQRLVSACLNSSGH